MFTFLKNLFRKSTALKSQELGVILSSGVPEYAVGDLLLPGNYKLPKNVSIKRLPFTTIPKNHMAVLKTKSEPPTYSTLSEAGAYPLNTDVTDVFLIPITNIVLNWSDLRMASHRLDSELKSIILHFDKDTVEFNVSLVIKINEISAIHLVARFGSVKNFVMEVLDVAISEFFVAYITEKNYAFLEKEKADFQDQLKNDLIPILAEFKVEIVDAFMNNFRVLRA